ncbi:MAG: hypothetical protein LBC83_02775 [Oscillospiraceae bacterium]|jgi:DNA polymerase III delta prime subunit|nr:hypothetical protein [Oscillospiraceae bacterium]
MPLLIDRTRSPALASAAVPLEGALAQGRLPHAILLEGGTAVQRRAAAEALGQVLLCAKSDPAAANDGAEETAMFGGLSLFGQVEAQGAADALVLLPCGACSHCVKLLAGGHPDVFFLEAGRSAKSNLQITVDEVRALRAEAYILPNEAARKVFVVHEAQQMNVQAQNALLKLLEEPPGYLCLVLTAPAARQMLATVRSRAAVFPLGEAREEAPDPEREAQIQTIAAGLAEALLNGDALEALKATAALEGQRELTCAVLPALRRALHERLKGGAGAGRTLALMENVQAQAEALERNGNLNLILARLVDG